MKSGNNFRCLTNVSDKVNMLTFFIFISFSAICISQVLYQQNFENYNIGESIPGWTNNSNIIATDTYVYSGNKAAQVTVNMPFKYYYLPTYTTGTIIFELAVKANSGGNCGIMGIVGGDATGWLPLNFFMWADQQIWKSWGPNGEGAWIFPANVDDWHYAKVTVQLGDVLIYDLMFDDTTVVTGAKMNLGVSFMEGGFKGIALHGGYGGPNYVDNIKITYIPDNEPILVDIRPGSEENHVNLKSKGVIPVAILTTSDFDATTLDPLTVEFGPDGAGPIKGKSHITDSDHNGDMDMLLHFRIQETGIQSSDTEATLTATTVDGQAVHGSDDITIVGNLKKEISDDSQTNIAPSKFIFIQNYPNPFNPETMIGFSIPNEELVSLTIFNIAGEKVITLLNDVISSGYHTVSWDGRNQSSDEMPSGIYLCKINTPSSQKTIRISLLR